MPRKYALGYSTCGFAPGRDMVSLVEKLSELGYDGVELELDRARLHPHEHDASVVFGVRDALRRTGLRGVVGTGGRHVLTETRHHPGAVSMKAEDRARWRAFVVDAMRMSAELGCGCVMIHSGYAPSDVPKSTAFEWLTDGLTELATHAERLGQRLALEWHPEMFVRTAADYLEAHRRVASKALGCTLDVGHAHCTEEQPPERVIAELREHTIHVQLEDMKDRVHKHLKLGQGQIDFEAVFQAFEQTSYTGTVALEFNAGDLGGSGDELARESIEYLRNHVSVFAERAS